MPDFQPFVPASDNRPEFTLRAVLLGSFFGIVFGAVTVYVGLEGGAYGGRFDSHRGAVDQHSAGVWAQLDS